MGKDFDLKAVYIDTIKHVREVPTDQQTYIFAYDLNNWKLEYVYQRCYFLVPKGDINED